MNVGRFQELLTIERPLLDQETVDDYGRRILPWGRVTQVYASAADVSGREYYEAAVHGMLDTVTFTTRYLRTLDTSMRILWRGECYQIQQINHLGYRGDFLRIKARRVEPEGVNRYGTV